MGLDESFESMLLVSEKVYTGKTTLYKINHKMLIIIITIKILLYINSLNAYNINTCK